LRVRLGGSRTSKLRDHAATIGHGESYNDEGEDRYQGYAYRDTRTIDDLGGHDVVNIQTLSPSY
jgi:hypothetical protein